MAGWVDEHWRFFGILIHVGVRLFTCGMVLGLFVRKTRYWLLVYPATLTLMSLGLIGYVSMYVSGMSHAPSPVEIVAVWAMCILIWWRWGVNEIMVLQREAPAKKRPDKE